MAYSVVQHWPPELFDDRPAREFALERMREHARENAGAELPPMENPPVIQWWKIVGEEPNLTQVPCAKEDADSVSVMLTWTDEIR